MSRYRLTHQAQVDLDEIWLSIAEHNIPAADRAVVFDSPERVIDRLTQFQEMLAITTELNPGGFLPMEAVHRSLSLLTEKVMPAFN